MEHRLISGGEQWLPFARSRIKALRATGLAYASQKFEIEGALIKVRIEPGHEYIEISGGGPLWVLIQFATSRTESTGEAGEHLPGSEARNEAITFGKCWLLRSSFDFSTSKLEYYGEDIFSAVTTTKHGESPELLEKTEVERTRVKGRVGVISGFALYGDKVMISGRNAIEKKVSHSYHRYREPAGNREDTYTDTVSVTTLLIGGVEYKGVFGKITSTSYGAGVNPPDQVEDKSSGLYVKGIAQTNDDFAIVRAALDGVDDLYFSVPFDYEGGVPPSWQESDKVVELPHEAGLCQGEEVDWGVWVSKDKYLGHPTTGENRGKLWHFELHRGVPHNQHPAQDSPMTEPLRQFDLRKLVKKLDDDDLTAAFEYDYASGGEFTCVSTPGYPPYPPEHHGVAGFNRGYRVVVTPTSGSNSIVDQITLTATVYIAPKRKL